MSISPISFQNTRLPTREELKDESIEAAKQGKKIRQCWNCFERNAASVCNRCNIASYCGRTCQVNDWKLFHRGDECNSLKALGHTRLAIKQWSTMIKGRKENAKIVPIAEKDRKDFEEMNKKLQKHLKLQITIRTSALALTDSSPGKQLCQLRMELKLFLENIKLLSEESFLLPFTSIIKAMGTEEHMNSYLETIEKRNNILGKQAEKAQTALLQIVYIRQLAHAHQQMEILELTQKNDSKKDHLEAQELYKELSLVTQSNDSQSALDKALNDLLSTLGEIENMSIATEAIAIELEKEGLDLLESVKDHNEGNPEAVAALSKLIKTQKSVTASNKILRARSD